MTIISQKKRETVPVQTNFFWVIITLKQKGIHETGIDSHFAK